MDAFDKLLKDIAELDRKYNIAERKSKYNEDTEAFRYIVGSCGHRIYYLSKEGVLTLFKQF